MPGQHAGPNCAWRRRYCQAFPLCNEEIERPESGTDWAVLFETGPTGGASRQCSPDIGKSSGMQNMLQEEYQLYGAVSEDKPANRLTAYIG